MDTINSVRFIEPLLGPVSESISKTRELKEFNTILDLVEMVARNALSGLKDFREGQLHRFDPSVGDEACQIRALMVLEAYKESAQFSESEAGVQGLVARVEALRSDLSSIQNDFLQKEEMAKTLLQPTNLAKQALSELRKKKSDLPKGSDEAKKIEQTFQEGMKKISQEAKPITDELKREQAMAIQNARERFLQADLEVSFPKMVRTLLLCHLVSKTGEVPSSGPLYKVKTCPRNIEIGTTLNGATLESIITRAKTILSGESVEFIRSETQKLGGKNGRRIQEILGQTLPSAKKGVQEVSFYHGALAVMKRVKASSIPILIKMRGPQADNSALFSQRILYAVDPVTKQYVATDMPSDEGSPALIIEGVGARQDGLQSHIERGGGVMGIVRLNAAQHRFCTSQTVPDPMILSHLDPAEIEKLVAERERACSEGFSCENYDEFMVEHIYTDLLKNQTE